MPPTPLRTQRGIRLREQLGKQLRQRPRKRLAAALLLSCALAAPPISGAQEQIDPRMGGPPLTGERHTQPQIARDPSEVEAGRSPFVPRPPEEIAASFSDEAEYPQPESAEVSGTLAPTSTCGPISDETTRKLCWEARRAYFDYYVSGMQHRKNVFAWQHFSTRVIFVIVLVLVGAGIYFAWVQFHRGTGAGETETELEISTQGIKVSSPVLGVIILVISLAFFYLYLVHVYPITEIL